MLVYGEDRWPTRGYAKRTHITPYSRAVKEIPCYLTVLSLLISNMMAL